MWNIEMLCSSKKFPKKCFVTHTIKLRKYLRKTLTWCFEQKYFFLITPLCKQDLYDWIGLNWDCSKIQCKEKFWKEDGCQTIINLHWTLSKPCSSFSSCKSIPSAIFASVWLANCGGPWRKIKRRTACRILLKGGEYLNIFRSEECFRAQTTYAMVETKLS